MQKPLIKLSIPIISVLCIHAMIPGTSIADSLDERYTEIKQHGGLKGFCIANPAVKECAVAIGEWKPSELEKVISRSIQCFDKCPDDTYGYVRSPDGTRVYPEVFTRDFDGWSPSRGVEFRIYPVAIEILKYDGCAGCSLVKSTPLKASMTYDGITVALPMLGYGVFYIPSSARRLAERAAKGRAPAIIDLEFSKDKESRKISTVALGEYVKMIQELRFSEIQ